MSNGTSLVLRVCRADLTSCDGFQYPAEVGATIEAPDWSDEPSCGKGLHGWLHGQGDHSCADYWSEGGSKWLVLEVVSAHIIMLGGKCKFPRATVRFIGGKSEAAAYLMANSEHAKNVAVIGASIEAPDKGQAVVGDLGTATAGRYGTAIAGDSGTAIAGDSGTATAGDSGTATAGSYGTATAGYSGTATAGYSGTATAGRYGTATAGEKGEIRIKYWDEEAERYRTKIGYIGEDGLLPDVAYKLDESHNFVEAK